VKIFGIGLSKTGTSSLQKALLDLGLRSSHCPIDARTYEQLVLGDYNLDVIHQNDALLDITAAPFYPQYDKLFPGSKFILTIRNLSHWLTSIQAHVEQVLLGGRWMDTFVPDHIEGKPLEVEGELFDFVRMCSFLHLTTYGLLGFDEDRFTHVSQWHFANVLDYFKNRPDDLLVMDITNGDGWDVLCPFLGLPKPDIPFPFENKNRGVNKIQLS
jgi:hypothetical protein